ncbi:putative acetyltransferase [Sinomonas atrocyanea]|uniref:GNAT family N-acetyltransferase n=1 Tax=Sinomonas atrocyanea TaxID=37927 RepID=UPI0027897EC5|nr:GNAT family N-acetyltransferase [Sinomonas atrocyanea]MDP9886151.1 putative acetyltransferase [Sinomonas atrocyanea]
MSADTGTLRGTDYEIRRFRPQPASSPDYADTERWIEAVHYGFYQKPGRDELTARIAESSVADDRELTGAYETEPAAAPALDSAGPVATFATFRKTLNVGHGVLVPAHMVTAVTVRTDHRRRGLLRRLMSEDLARAKADGVPVAALTASEASIYRRFGYGVATHERSVSVETGPRFRLPAPVRGRVVAAEPAAMLDLAPEIFARAHRAIPGSLGRQERYRLRAAGQWDDETGGPDRAVRVAVHLDEQGIPDGYAAYAFRGWETEPPTMALRDLVAATPEAYLGLWDFLGSLDLIERVEWEDAPVDDPLVWALEDPRVVRTGSVRDMLWLRILDVEAALSARKTAHDGELVLRVHDPLGFTDGRYRLSSSAGTARVSRVGADDPGQDDLIMDIAELSSVYVGGVSPVTLAEAGRIRVGAGRPDAAAELARMLAVERPAHCLTHF